MHLGDVTRGIPHSPFEETCNKALPYFSGRKMLCCYFIHITAGATGGRSYAWATCLGHSKMEKELRGSPRAQATAQENEKLQQPC